MKAFCRIACWLLLAALPLAGAIADELPPQEIDEELLAPAPWVDPDAPPPEQPPPSALKAVSAVPAIDTSDRSAVVAAFNTYYNLAMPALNFTGSVTTCTPGTIALAFQEWVLTRVNFMRAMAGVPGNTVLDSSKDVQEQSAALMMVANNALSHNPPSSWTCYSTAGYNGAASSNLTMGSSLVDPIPNYMSERGASNKPVGHRRWILDSKKNSFGLGQAIGATYRANAMYVLQQGSAVAVPNGIPWPPRGYVPMVLFPTPASTEGQRWSFGLPGANFSAANVAMTLNGSPLALTVISRTDNGYAENTIVWELPVGHVVAKGSTYGVAITGVGSAASTTYSYDVLPFDPAEQTGGTAQTITFGALSNRTFGDPPFTVSATASSGLVVTFSSQTAAVCSVSGTTVTLVGGGTCTIAANQGGNATYAPAPQVTQSFSVGKANQTITFGALADRALGTAPFTVSATASSGLTVAFSTLTAPVCTVSGSTVTLVSTGTCTIAANQAGSASYNAAPQVTQSFTVLPQVYTLTVSKSGSGTGTVVSSPSGISCGATCSATYAGGAVVTLNAVPDAGSFFLGWSGAGCSGTDTCTVTLNAAASVTATFHPSFAVSISGAQVSPSTSSMAVGAGTANIDPAANTITYSFSVTGLSGPITAARLHGAAARGANTSSKADITANPFSGTVSYTQGNESAILNGEWYVLYSTAAFPSGEVRGQLDNLGGLFRLMVSKAGAGTGSVSSSQGAIACGATCADNYVEGASVTLTATPDSGSSFSGWSGACTGTGTCQVPMNTTQAVTATFAISSQAPAITSANTTTFTVGMAGSFTVTATGTPTPTRSMTGTLPGGVTFTAATGVLAGTPTAAGNFPLTFTATNGVSPDASQSFTLVVDKGNQTISFGSLANRTFGTAPFTVSATATSGLAVAFTSTTTSVCTVSGTTVTLVAAGTCTIAANQAGNANYNPAPQVTQSFNVAASVPGAPTIGAATAGNAQASIAFTPPANTGGSPITGYTATCNPGAISAGGTASPITVTGLTNGTAYTCSVTATNVAGTGAASGTVGVTPTLPPAAPAITSANTTTFTVGVAGSFTVTVTGNPTPTRSMTGTLPGGVTFTAATGVLAGTPTAAGNFPLTFTATNGVSPDASQSFTLVVDKGNQTITFGALANKTFGDAPFGVSATASSGLSVAFTSTTTSVCTVSGTTVTLVAAGTCTIAADQAGSANYNPAPQVTQSFNVAATVPGAPTIGAATAGDTQASIAFTPPANTGGSPITAYTATCNPGGITGTGTGSPITVAGLTNGTAYTCSVTATNAAGTSPASGTVGATPAPIPTAPTITSANTATFTVGVAGSFTVTATGTPAPTRSMTGTLPAGVSFTSATGALAGTPTVAGAFPLVVDAVNGVAPNATQEFTLVVAKANQTLSFPTPPNQTYSTTPVTVSATATSGLPVAFTSNTPTLCTVSGTSVTLLAAGTCSIAANQAGDANYNAAPTVSRGFTITATLPGAPTMGTATAGNAQATIAFTPPASTGGSPITGYATTCTPGPVNATGSASPITVTGLTNGTAYSCSVRAINAVGTGPASASASVTPNAPPAAPVITSAGTATFTVGVAVGFTVTVTGNPAPTLSLAGTLPAGLTFAAGTGLLSGTPTAAGTFPLTVGATNGIAPDASQSLTITVDKGNQSISFVGPQNQAYGTTPITITATATSGLPVLFSTTTPSVCSVSGTSVTKLATGACTIAADQAGNANYNPAPQVTQSFNISATVPGAPTIGTATNGDAQASIAFTPPANNGGSPITGYTATCNPGAISASGTASPITVTGLANGTPYSCSVRASNSVGTSAASGTVSVVPAAGPVAPTIGSANSTTFTVGVAGGFTVTATGNPTPTRSVTGTLPGGVTFTPASGLLSGTPTATGTFPLTIGASNGVLPAATQAFTLVVAKDSQTIDFPQSADRTLGDVPFIVSATASSGLPVSFASTTPAFCTLSGTTVTLVASGFCTIVASQPGDSTYGAAPPVQRTIFIYPEPTNTLTVIIIGDGTVEASPNLLDCETTCTAELTPGTALDLTATAVDGSIFLGWSGGGCTGTGICSVVLDESTTVTANFTSTAGLARLVNVSTRGQVLTGDDVMIAGFVIGGSRPKRVLVTARGPSLAGFNIPGTLQDPFLQLFSGPTQIASNDDWTASESAQEIDATGFAPAFVKESAIVATLNPGAYTAIVTGTGGSTGVGIVEVFEIDTPEVPLVNISTRANVGLGDNVMIAGFVIQGDSPRKLLVTARGPSLADPPFGVPGTLLDPHLRIFSGQTVIHQNDDWKEAANFGDIPEALRPGNDKEAAVLVTLSPGSYTVVVSGVNNATGIAIVEVFTQ